MTINILDQTPSVLNHYMSEIRDKVVQQDSMRFRRNIERIGELVAFELSKTLEFELCSVTTPLGQSDIPLLTRQPYLVAVLRAAVPFHQGFLNMFDRAESGFIGAYRSHTSELNFGIDLDYIATDSLQGKDVIIIDPMLASGKSVVEVLAKLKGRGEPRSIHVAAVISALPGLQYLSEQVGDKITVWTASVDNELNDHAYIVPGLGDAGDLCFGAKL